MEWINIDDKLPDESLIKQEYLFTNGFGVHLGSYWPEDGDPQWHTTEGEVMNVKYWIAVPDIPDVKR